MKKHTLQQMKTIMKIGGPIDVARIPIPDRIIDDELPRALTKYAIEYNSNTVLKEILIRTNGIPALNKNERRSMFYEILSSGKFTDEVKSLLVEREYADLFMNLYDEEHLNKQADIIPTHFILYMPIALTDQLLTTEVFDLIFVRTSLYKLDQELFFDLIVKLIHSNLSDNRYSNYHVYYKRILEVVLELYSLYSIDCPVSYESYRLLSSIKCITCISNLLIMSGVSASTLIEYDTAYREYVHNEEMRKLEKLRLEEEERKLYEEFEAKRKIELKEEQRRHEANMERQRFLRKQEEIKYRLTYGPLRYAKQNEPMPHAKSGGREIGFNRSIRTSSPIKIYGYCTIEGVYSSQEPDWLYF